MGSNPIAGACKYLLTSPLSPIGRGSGLKIRAVWVRVPQRARGLGEARTLTSRPFLVLRAIARLAQQVEAADLESAQSGFESRGGHACCTVSVRCSYVTGSWWCNHCHGMPAFRVSPCIPTGRGNRLKSGTVWVRIPPGALKTPCERCLVKPDRWRLVLLCSCCIEGSATCQALRRVSSVDRAPLS